GEICNALMWATFMHFALVFPQPPARLSRRPRLVWLCYGAPFALYALGVAVARPTAQSPLARVEQTITISAVAGRVVPAVLPVPCALAYRRTKEPAGRQRLQIVIASLLIALLIYLLLGQIPDAVLGHPLVGWDVAQLGFILCPLGIGAAILRYGLFDIQV